MIGFAQFAGGEVEPLAERLDRLVDLARAVPTMEIQAALGIQSKPLPLAMTQCFVLTMLVSPS